MEEHSIEDRFASIEAKLELLLHKLDQRIQNDSLMEQGVLPYQMSSTLTFQKEKELFLAKEQNFTDMDENKKMSSLHQHKFPDLDTFQVNTTSARLKKIEGQIGHLVQAFKDKFSRTSPNNTLKNPIECMDAHLSNVQKFHILKSVEEGENELEIENKTLLNNLEDEEPLVDKLKFEEESQVMAIENILVKIDTFTFPMDFVTWGIEGDLQNSHILRRPLLSSSQAWIDINKGELTLLVGEKAKFNLHQPLPLTEQERAMCRKFCSLLQSKGHMFEQSPLTINVFTSTSNRGDCFEEIVAEPPAIIKGDFEFLSPLQCLKENILELNGFEEEVLSKMNDWSNGSTSTFPMSLAGL